MNHTDSTGFRKWGNKGGILLATDVDHVFSNNIRMVDTTGGIYLGWYNNSDSLILQHLSGSGELLFGPDGLPGGRIGVSNGIGGIIISRRWWNTDRHLAQNFDNIGNPLWGIEDVLYSSRANSERVFSIADRKGGAIFIWSERSIPPNRGILCQRVNRYGQLGGLATKVNNFHHLKPYNFLLHQNYPNPFNSETTINFQLPEENEISLLIYNIKGELIRTVIDQMNFQTGIHSIIWDGKNNYGKDVSSGVFLYTLRVGEQFISKKMLLTK